MASSTPNRIQILESFNVRIKAVFNSGTGRLLNLSSAGAYVATPMYLLPQAQVQLQIILPNEKRWIETDAVVAWENRGTGRRGGLPPGYGLRFIKVPEETTEVIGQLLVNSSVPAAKPADAPSPQSDSPPSPPPSPVETVRFEIPSDLAFEMEGDGPPFRLRGDVVRTRVPERVKGIYVLSYDRTQDALVGRADEDLREALSKFEGEYAFFYYENIDRVDERFYRECELYHRLGGDRGQLDNKAHPARPSGTVLVCPICASQTIA